MKTRSITAERAVALAAKVFDARKTSVVALHFFTVDGQKEALQLSSARLDVTAATCKEVVLRNLDKLPEQGWLWAVAEHGDGSRSQVTLMEKMSVADGVAELSEKLHEANTYVDPNFNCDTSTNVAGLTALKGGAPDLDDKIYMYGVGGVFPVLTVESAMSCLQIRLGEMSSGAAAAGQKRGDLTVNANLTFAGAAAGTNSGVSTNCASGAAESKGIVAQYAGTSGAHIVFTNQGGAVNSSQRWQLYHIYGAAPVISYVDLQYSYDAPFLSQFGSATYSSATNGNFTVIDCTAKGVYTSAQPLISIASANTGYTGAIDIGFTSWDLTGCAASFNPIILSAASTRISTGSLVVRGCLISPAPATGCLTYPIYVGIASGVGLYTNTWRLTPTDVRPTTVVPTTLVLTNLRDGTVKIEIGNIAAYRTLATNGIEDFIQLYDASNNPRGGACSKTRYVAVLDRKPANCFILAGVPLSAMANWYAKATSDGYTYSAASAVASTITPDLLPATTDVRFGTGYGQGGTEKSGLAHIPTAADVAADTAVEQTMGAIALASILPPRGTCNKLYSAAEELSRNTITPEHVEEYHHYIQQGDPVVGESPSEKHTDDEVIQSASVPGNWDDSNLPADGGGDGNMAAGKSFGIGRAGSRTDADPAVVRDDSSDYGDPANPITPLFALAAWEAARNYKTALATDIVVGKSVTLAGVTTDGAASAGSPLISISIILDAATYAVGGLATVAGGVTSDQSVTGATVMLLRKKKSDGSTVATLVNATVNLVATVQKTWASILGAACTFAPATAQEEYLEATVSGGTPAITAEMAGQATYAVRPGRPGWSAEPTAGDGRITVHLSAAAETDILYPVWRTAAGSFSEPSENFKRTGSGDLAITGLTNDILRYGFLGVAKAGTLWSLPSLVEQFATPTAGATAAAGPLSLPAEYLRELQAQSTTWQTWCAAGSPEEAKDHIYKVAVPGVGSAIAAKRPFSLIDQGSKWDRAKVAGGARNYFDGSGDLLWMVEAEVPEALSASDKHDLAQDWFMNRVGQIIDEMIALAGSGSYLCVNAFRLQEGPSRSEKKVRQTEGDYFQVLFAVEWGN